MVMNYPFRCGRLKGAQSLLFDLIYVGDQGLDV